MTIVAILLREGTQPMANERNLCDAHRAALARYRELTELDVVNDPRSNRNRFRITHEEATNKTRLVVIARQVREPGGWKTVASFRMLESQVGPLAESLSWIAANIRSTGGR
jgi:hypothetical protein